MIEQENFQQVLGLVTGGNEVLRAGLTCQVLKDDAELPCHEFIDELLPNEVSSSSESSDNDIDSSDDNDDESDEEESYATPSLESSDSEVEAYLNESDSDDPSGNPDLISLNKDLRQTNITAKGDIITKGRPSSCIFVASLAATLSDDQLCQSVTEKFHHFGKLNGVKVLRDPQNRPYAFVQYTNDHDAQRALNLSQGSTLNDRIIRCEQARVNRTIFISCSQPVACREIEIFCERFGEIEQLIPSLNIDPNRPNERKKQILPNFRFVDAASYKVASWFVQFAYRDDAIRAFANIKSELSWTVHWVQNVRVPKRYNLLSSFQKSQNEQFKSRHTTYTDSKNHYNNINISIDRKSIFVGQLHKDTTTESLTKHFEIYGKIFNLKLVHRPTNIFAFIEYDDESSAAIALEKENHATFMGKTIHVQYKEVNTTFSYVRRESRNIPQDNPFLKATHDNNNNNGNRVFIGPQVTLAPPPINITRRKHFGNADVDWHPNNYTASSIKEDEYRRHSFPVEWMPPSTENRNIHSSSSDSSVEVSGTSHKDAVTYQDDEGSTNNCEHGDSDGKSSDTVNTDYASINMAEDTTQLSMSSYNESSRGSLHLGKSQRYNSYPKGRRFSHPPGPYYQPQYYPYQGSSHANNQPFMMYYPPIPLPPPEVLHHHQYYQHNPQIPPYGPGLIPMMMPHGPPVPTQVSGIPPGFMPTSPNANTSVGHIEEGNTSTNNQTSSKHDTPHVSFQDITNSVDIGDDVDPSREYSNDNHNRFHKLLRNQIPSFKPGNIKATLEDKDFTMNKSPEYLDY